MGVLGGEVVGQEPLPYWMRFGGEERARMEYAAGVGFRPINDCYLLNRLRLNLVSTWT